VNRAQNAFNGYMQQLYMGGQVSGTTGALLTANDPGALLQQSTLEGYQSDHQISAIGDLQRATVAKSNADAKARAAVQAEAKAAKDAQDAQSAAAAAFAAAKAQQAQLQSTLADTQHQLQAAQLHLAELNDQRQKYLAYQAEQARLAEIRRQQELARERAAAAAAAAAAAQNNGGGGGGSVGGYVPPPPSGGGWTPSKGQTAANRALHWLGTMYAWAGGNASGPTYGVCAGDGAFNDCNVIGFDCSGLAMYAWAQIPLAHYAATQYTQAGNYHPSTGNLQPGDLVFWSSDGTIGGIHHVAIYIGGGNVVQAPESGSVIQVTPLDEVSWGYFGATRPLT
jgi:cell wall-associated NlpC family hydrolase